MSAENVQLVREALRQFAERGEPSGMASPDFVWDMSGLPDWLDEAVYRGEDGFRAFWERWTEAYDEWDGQIEEAIDLDGEHVVIGMHQRGRVHGTEAWVEMRCALLYTVRDGQLRRARLFQTIDEALTAHRAEVHA